MIQDQQSLQLSNRRSVAPVFRLVVWASLSVVVFPQLGWTHEMRPGYLAISETTPGAYDVLWKVPARGASQRLRLNVKFAPDVKQVATPSGTFIGQAHVQQFKIAREGGLAGSVIRIDGLENTYTDVLLRIERLDGITQTHRLTAASPAFLVESDPGLGQVAWTYFVLGVEHILFGIDHLLFVLALLLLVDNTKKLIGTITAFTVAHSITLAMASLGWVQVPGAPVEAVIALSIVFVASEIVRGRQGEPGLAARYPWLVAFSFGLLHGFGFAGALAEIGLPQQAIPMSLLMFNVGVEGGQLLFVFAFLLLKSVFERYFKGTWEWAGRVAPYGIGGLAAFWTLERTAGFWGG